MKNYVEKEKKLHKVLEKLNTMSSEVAKMNEDINLLNLEKNQLLREKKESEKNFLTLSRQHELLKSKIKKADIDLGDKFGDNNNLKKKIDELNQETEILIDEIEQWQT